MNNPIVFFNIGWMDFYQGTSNDLISGGGSYVAEHGFGHEIFNFKEYEGMVYGYVQPPSKNSEYSQAIINISRIAFTFGNTIQNCTVIWVSRDRLARKTVIVGWYLNATIYKRYQKPPSGSARIFKGEEIGYYCMTKVENARLLSPDERQFEVPRGKKGYLGQSNVWFADNVPDPNFIKSVFNYISTEALPQLRRKSQGRSIQNDSLKRIEVEKAAVHKVIEYYTNLGYDIESVEKDNVGWDLTATKDKLKLKLEVKGLSGSEISAELTSNEYFHLNQDKINYRICIVTKALKKKAKLSVFRFSMEKNSWISNEGEILQLKEIVSVRVSI